MQAWVVSRCLSGMDQAKGSAIMHNATMHWVEPSHVMGGPGQMALLLCLGCWGRETLAAFFRLAQDLCSWRPPELNIQIAGLYERQTPVKQCRVYH